jgi:hypothetical protein
MLLLSEIQHETNTRDNKLLWLLRVYPLNHAMSIIQYICVEDTSNNR